MFGWYRAQITIDYIIETFSTVTKCYAIILDFFNMIIFKVTEI